MADSKNYRSGAWHGVVANEWRDELAQLDRWLAEHPGEVVATYPSRRVTRVKTARGNVYIKEIFALTDTGLKGKDIVSWLKWVFRPSRAVQAFAVSDLLLNSGINCAKPVLGARKRSGSLYPTDIFITEEVNAPILADILTKEKDPARLNKLVFTLGRELCRLHRSGFVHGDCILRNICLEPNSTVHCVDNQVGTIYYLDNDRTKYKDWYCFWISPRRNVAQLGYSIMRITNDSSLTKIFLNSYCEACRSTGGKEPYDRNALLQEISLRYRQRLQADKKRNVSAG